MIFSSVFDDAGMSGILGSVLVVDFLIVSRNNSIWHKFLTAINMEHPIASIVFGLLICLVLLMIYKSLVPSEPSTNGGRSGFAEGTSSTNGGQTGTSTPALTEAQKLQKEKEIEESWNKQEADMSKGEALDEIFEQNEAAKKAQIEADQAVESRSSMQTIFGEPIQTGPPRMTRTNLTGVASANGGPSSEAISAQESDATILGAVTTLEDIGSRKIDYEKQRQEEIDNPNPSLDPGTTEFSIDSIIRSANNARVQSNLSKYKM